jgi:hypothetical protein
MDIVNRTRRDEKNECQAATRRRFNMLSPIPN